MDVPRRPGTGRFAFRAASLLALLFVAAPRVFPESQMGTLSRDEEPVLTDGAAVPDLLGKAIPDIAVFKFDAASGTFKPIPFQIDERVNHVFNAGTPLQFTETMYDVFHEDDGLLDEIDMIAFLYGDAGTQAPPGSAWVPGADPMRLEIALTDTRPGANQTRWVYVFTGPSLPRSPVSYVSWNLAAGGSISTGVYQLDYADRWLLTGYRVFAPCGSGADLIDRVKGRAVPLNQNSEDEENWNNNSSYLGGLLGPVRAIRYVRGATSGVNTIHHDLVYRGFWKRTVRLRVHPLLEASIYIDWRPTPAATQIFTPLVPTGVPLDGSPDATMPSTFVPWTVVRHPDGGVVLLYDIPDTGQYQSKSFNYHDDSSYDDRVPANPDYSDEDHSAYGNVGVKIVRNEDCNIEPILMEFRSYPICAGIGDSAMGSGYQEFLQYPVQRSTTSQWATANPVRTLQVDRDGRDLVLTWQSVSGAVTYRVYASAFADTPPQSWTLLADSPANTYRDPGAADPGPNRFYSVAAVNGSGEVVW